VTEFNQGIELGRAFQGWNQLMWLQSFGEPWGLMPTGNALCFLDNHDNQRHGGANILTYKNPRPYKMATAFELAWDYGYPRMMSSYAFDNPDMGPPHDLDNNILPPGFYADDTCSNGWVCEHRWRQMYNMVAFRNTVEGK
jgi:alpha-amylase